jgi:spermidine synthase
MRPSRGSFIYAIFVLSGATSLAYEVIWTRLLVRVFGSTSLAVTTVLASYMAGLAIGSYLLGKWIDRRWSPLRVYGLLELGIGIFALIFPLVILVLNLFYGAVHPAFEARYPLLTAVRFALSFLVLLIPTTLMGGTLPVLSKYVAVGRRNLAERIGVLYAANTFGAVAGAFGTGYLLLPRLGINHTSWLCVLFNVCIFACVMVMARRASGAARVGGEVEQSSSEPSTLVGRSEVIPLTGVPSVRQDRLVLIAFMLTGFAALSAEVLWTRVLTLVIGTTVYAFSAMLGTFLLGLALGGAVFARVAGRVRRPGLVFAAVVAAIGISVFLTSVAFGRLPFLYMEVGHHVGWVWGRMMWVQFLVCILIMLVPTFLMGGTFPLVARLYVRNYAALGHRVGTAYAFNTVGSIFGSFAGGLIFLRMLGIEKSLQAVSGIYLAAGIALLLGVTEIRRSRQALTVAVVVGLGALAFVLSPRWDRGIMTSGVYRYAQAYKSVENLRETIKKTVLLFYDDGPGATVTVARADNEISLGIDGKVDASTGIGDMTAQAMVADLPLLFHPKPDTVLLIGLGCGVSLGSAEQYPIKSIECVELLENVVRASRFFNEYNNYCLADSRLRLVIGDGRNHVMLTNKTYDVIISEPTNPWISGVGDLFTREFFEATKHRLKPGGVMAIWFQLYQMGDSELRAVAKTLLAVFPQVTMWMPNGASVVFLASLDPLVFDNGLLGRLEIPAVKSGLSRIWVDEISDVLSAYVWGTEGVGRYAGGQSRLLTDDNMMLEFSVSRRIFAPTDTTHLSNILRSMEAPPLGRMDVGIAERVGHEMDARRQVVEGTVESLKGHGANAIALYDSAYRRAPYDPYVLSAFVEAYISLGSSLASRGNYGGALDAYLKAVVEPTYQYAWRGYSGAAFCAAKLGDFSRLRQYYELSLEGNPFNGTAAHNLAMLYMRDNKPDAAVAVLERLLAISPNDPEAAGGLARIYASRGESPTRALELAKMAAASERTAPNYTTLGWLYYDRGQLDEAREALKVALKLAPDDSETLYRLALVEIASVNRARARRYLERLIGLGRQDGFTASAKELLRELPAE